MSDWSYFDKKVDTKGLSDDVKNLKDGDFPDIPPGKYQVALDSMEMKPTKERQLPMLAFQFTILKGDLKDQKIFVNQLIYNGDKHDALRLKNANTFLKSLGTDYDVMFTSFSQYNQLVDRIADEVIDAMFELEVGKNSKGYTTYKILQAY